MPQVHKEELRLQQLASSIPYNVPITNTNYSVNEMKTLNFKNGTLF